jgi:hypothetical protein
MMGWLQAKAKQLQKVFTIITLQIGLDAIDD